MNYAGNSTVVPPMKKGNTTQNKYVNKVKHKAVVVRILLRYVVHFMRFSATFLSELMQILLIFQNTLSSVFFSKTKQSNFLEYTPLVVTS